MQIVRYTTAPIARLTSMPASRRFILIIGAMLSTFRLRRDAIVAPRSRSLGQTEIPRTGI